ncbi:MAG TPA: hypothetical protein EYO33_21760 [Phycisphaerales bacterium]|nr:hypothetical protein [Phycisphaerales bacterium]
MKRLTIAQLLILLFLFTAALPASAQLDERLVGRWKSSTGSTIDIKHPRVGDGSYTILVVNNKTQLDGTVDWGDMDSLVLTYKSGGSEMKAYYDPQTKIITVYDGPKKYATWTKQ